MKYAEKLCLKERRLWSFDRNDLSAQCLQRLFIGCHKVVLLTR